ncbi:hypothetical protein HPB52_007872 [Rhipicephalus sanguineus]|uniref:Uncharacterized protein n=1 Tax=Rhipicephalus sanguineus TaxID=34632 RepID=A0A9D4QI69_RHISA|nr:hypothetical protein HPB52_007872 [Rhipicephalus sanguineus]
MQLVCAVWSSYRVADGRPLGGKYQTDIQTGIIEALISTGKYLPSVRSAGCGVWPAGLRHPEHDEGGRCAPRARSSIFSESGHSPASVSVAATGSSSSSQGCGVGRSAQAWLSRAIQSLSPKLAQEANWKCDTTELIAVSGPDKQHSGSLDATSAAGPVASDSCGEATCPNALSAEDSRSEAYGVVRLREVLAVLRSDISSEEKLVAIKRGHDRWLAVGSSMGDVSKPRPGSQQGAESQHARRSLHKLQDMKQLGPILEFPKAVVAD